MAYDPKSDASAPRIHRNFSYHSDGSDVGQNRRTRSKNTKNPISIANPLSVSERFGAFHMRETVEDVIRDQLKMILLTNKGERVGNHEFGADVRRIIFESNVVDDIDDILARSIQENVQKFMPGVRLVDMSIFTPDQFDELRETEILLRVRFQVESLDLKSRIELVIGDR